MNDQLQLQLQALARKTADKLFDSLGLVNSASKSEAIILAALEEAVKEAKRQMQAVEYDVFHLTAERDALRTQADALATALGLNRKALDVAWKLRNTIMLGPQSELADRVNEFDKASMETSLPTLAALAAYRKEKQL